MSDDIRRRLIVCLLVIALGSFLGYLLAVVTDRHLRQTDPAYIVGAGR
jgi:hypothetical protein